LIDLNTQAWLKYIGRYCGANTNDPAKLKKISADPSEWSKRLKLNFDYVLAEKATALDYESQNDVSFVSDVDPYPYLHRLYDFLYSSGPLPDLI
jgi:hypothetical protein